MNKLFIIISLFVISCGGDVIEEQPQIGNTTTCMFDINYLNYVSEMKGMFGVSDDADK
jgi:hypothetical protein